MKNKLIYKAIIRYSFILLILFAISCTYDKASSVDPAVKCNTALPDTVSFSKNILPVFAQNCSTPGCHSGSNPEGNLNLEASVAYSKISKSGSGYVDTINPKKSVIYSSLMSTSSPMPPTGKLDECSIELIVKWMEQNAKNN